MEERSRPWAQACLREICSEGPRLQLLTGIHFFLYSRGNLFLKPFPWPTAVISSFHWFHHQWSLKRKERWNQWWKRWRKKWKRLRDGWILDPFTAIRLYLLPQGGEVTRIKKERNGCNLTPFDRQLISFIIFLILFLLPVNPSFFTTAGIFFSNLPGRQWITERRKQIKNSGTCVGTSFSFSRPNVPFLIFFLVTATWFMVS